MTILPKRHRWVSYAAAAVLLTALSSSSLASAASPADRAAARNHLDQGLELKKKGQLQEALTHLLESQRLDPKLMTLIDLAETEEQLGQLVEAAGHWAAARDQAQKDSAPRTKQRAEERLAAVETKLPHLTLQLAADAAGAQVLRDGAPVDAAALGTPQRMNPGDHSVVVKLQGHDDATYNVTLAEGDNQTLPLAAGPKTAAAAPPPPPPPPPPPKPQAQVSVDSSSGSGQRVAGLLLGGVGLVGVGGGTFLWISGAQRANSLGPSADRNKLLGKISVGAGGVLLVTGVVLFVTAPSGQEQVARLPLLPIIDIDRDRAVLGAAAEF
ncbi:MAG TPA: hypothetical protein VJN18_08725 [Polyangiaceae bacterium]|nr:hypothetical protein [Polyangiaceae bacterium]